MKKDTLKKAKIIEEKLEGISKIRGITQGYKGQAINKKIDELINSLTLEYTDMTDITVTCHISSNSEALAFSIKKLINNEIDKLEKSLEDELEKL